MIYNFLVKNNLGKEVSLEQFKGKLLLIVNTATKCGLTPQYEDLQNLYKKYKDEGLEILDFPCNQFFEQAPETDEEIGAFCSLNYSTEFPRFAKIDVNGEKAAPLYKHLREVAPKAEESVASENLYKVLKENNFESIEDEIKWNFTKFLVDREGNVIKRLAPTLSGEELEAEVKKYL